MHPHTCLRRFDCMALWRLYQGNKPTLRGIFKVFTSKVKLQLCILTNKRAKNHLYDTPLTPVCLLCSTVLMQYLEHTGGKEGLTLHILRDLKSRTQVVAWKTRTRNMRNVAMWNRSQMSYVFMIMRARTAETAPFLEKEICPLSRSK